MSQLPDFLRPYFWEVDFDRLRLPEREVYVIERVLEYGEDRAIRWLKATVPPEKLAEVVRRSRRLSPNTANLWSLVLDIPRDEVRCLSELFPPMPGGS
ncbi:MAG: hypothetical protein Kow0063_06170 [Anaerolineae bacterium]